MGNCMAPTPGNSSTDDADQVPDDTSGEVLSSSAPENMLEASSEVEAISAEDSITPLQTFQNGNCMAPTPGNSSSDATDQVPHDTSGEVLSSSAPEHMLEASS